MFKTSQSVGEAHEVSIVTASESVEIKRVVETKPKENEIKAEIPRHLVEKSGKNLSDQEILELEDLILEYQDVFADDEYDLAISQKLNIR